MATYVLGDIQGCFDALRRLLDKIPFDPQTDRLWAVGDLVNRGPDNLSTLRFMRDLGDRAVTVLGNHDLHLLAVEAGVRKLGRKDTLQDVLQAPDAEELLTWLRHRPLVHIEGPYVLSHAGIPHIWCATEARELAKEVETHLQHADYRVFLQHMYGDQPNRWSANLSGWDRLRVIVNYFTRMRFIGAAGNLDLDAKEGVEQAPVGMQPWYLFPRADSDQFSLFLFGHWAALKGNTGKPRFVALDTGCVWGESLTAIRLDDGERFQVPAQIFVGP
jgi:bis(5'-nucleosyl)-tetraphosphatase (symmetrical)